MLYDIFGLDGILIRRHLWACALSLLSTIIILAACGNAQQAGSGSPPASVPPPAASLAPYPWGPAPTLDGRIFLADAIAIVRPISVEPGVITVQDTQGQTLYNPVIQSRFEVIEYLMGDGASEIIVDAKDLLATGDLSAEQALQNAEGNVAAQDSGTGGGEAVVFFRRAQYPDSVLDTSRKADETEWRRHNSQVGLFSADGGVSGASTTFHVVSASAAEVEWSETFSIDDLRERIEAMESLLREGEGIEGWRECIGSKLSYDNYLRNYRTTRGEDPPNRFEPGPLPSGQPAGFTAHSGDRFGGRGYSRQWLAGEDASFFQILILEGGQVITPDYWATRNQPTAYDTEIRAMRPLPAGLYEIYRHGQSPRNIPCDFVAPPFIWMFTFDAPAGTLHEAFFDPVDIDNAVGADGYDGVLQPEWFDADYGEVLIERIEWQDGQVEMELSPAADLFGRRMDFIALDGSVALRLDFDEDIGFEDEDDTSTFTWGVCEQPWEDGDLLMLRIASGDPTDGVQTTNDLECLNAPTVTPTPTEGSGAEDSSVPTPTPTPASP